MFTFQHLEANGTAALLTRNDRGLLALDPSNDGSTEHGTTDPELDWRP